MTAYLPYVGANLVFALNPGDHRSLLGRSQESPLRDIAGYIGPDFPEIQIVLHIPQNGNSYTIELIRTVRQMRKEFNREEEVTKGELRAAIFDVMNFSLRYWELASGKTKLDLAEQSGIWTITKDYYEDGSEFDWILKFALDLVKGQKIPGRLRSYV